MFERLFKRKSGYIDVEDAAGGGKKRNVAVIAMIIAAVCLLGFGGNDRQNGKENAEEVKTAAQFDLAEYTAGAENRLKTILSGIKGAGHVDVMLSFETVNEKVLAKNSRNENTSDTEENKKVSSSGSEESILIYGSGSGEQPFVIKERLPSPSGVLVLSSGAGDETVRLELYEAVKALYGISGHRIKVAQFMSK